MFPIIAIIAAVVIGVYAAYVMKRSKRRSFVMMSAGYERAHNKIKKIGIKKSFMNDFLIILVAVTKEHEKKTDVGDIMVFDGICLSGKAAYSGPTEVTYFVLRPNRDSIPDFTVRRRRFFETSTELKGFEELSGSGVVASFSDGGKDYIGKNIEGILDAFEQYPDLVLRGRKNCIICWCGRGFLSNDALPEIMDNVETFYRRLG